MMALKKELSAVWQTWGWRRKLQEEEDDPPESPKLKEMYAKVEKIFGEESSPEKLKDNPYKGKPLDLGRNPYEKNHAMAHRILKNAGFKPFWVELKEEIVAERRALAQVMSDHIEYLRHFSGSPGGADRRRLAQEAHERFLGHLEDRILELRKKIQSFNLEVPIVDQQMVNLRYESFTEEFRSACEQVIGSL